MSNQGPMRTHIILEFHTMAALISVTLGPSKVTELAQSIVAADKGAAVDN